MSTPLELLAVKKWDVGQLAALVYKLGDENARAINADNVRVRLEPSCFSTPEEQVKIWKEVELPDGPISSARNVFLHCSSQPGVSTLPAWPKCKTAAPVLALVGSSAEAELKFYWELLSKCTKVHWSWDSFSISHDKVSWWKDSGNQDGLWSFKWQIIDFSSHNGERTPDGRSKPIREVAAVSNPRYPNTFPSAGVLAALLVHPRYCKMIANREVPNMDIAGYDIAKSPDQPHVVSAQSSSPAGVYITATRAVTDYGFSVPTFYTEEL